jgi:hypothetical protein
MEKNKTLIRVLAATAMVATLGVYSRSMHLEAARDSIFRAQAEATNAVHCYSPAYDMRAYDCASFPSN